VYNPRSYRNENRDELFALMRRFNFATLFTHRAGESFVSHLPFMVDPARGAHGTLISHMAKANPHWRGFEGAAPSVVAYISPAWYVEQETVPTWNYAVVHVTGTPRLVTDVAALRRIVTDLMDHHEAPHGAAWDRRKATIDEELPGIVGFEIPIDRIEGKFKLNQNRSREDQEGVIAALEQSADPAEREVARLMRANLNRPT
jgi:transcriptional regulator